MSPEQNVIKTLGVKNYVNAILKTGLSHRPLETCDFQFEDVKVSENETPTFL